MISDISKTTLKSIVGDPMKRKAISMAIYLKCRNHTSVWKDCSFRTLAKESGVSVNTAIRYIEILKRLHLARTYEKNGHKYLELKKLRSRKIKNKKNDRYHTPKHSDVSLRDIDLSSIRTIEEGLSALAIEIYAKRIDKARRLIQLAANSESKASPKSVMRARKICRELGWAKYDDGGNEYFEFEERGVPYRRIRRMLHCSPNTAKRKLAAGEACGLFTVVRRECELLYYAGWGKAKAMLKEVKYIFPSAFATKSNIFVRPALLIYPKERSNPFRWC